MRYASIKRILDAAEIEPWKRCRSCLRDRRDRRVRLMAHYAYVWKQRYLHALTETGLSDTAKGYGESIRRSWTNETRRVATVERKVRGFSLIVRLAPLHDFAPFKRAPRSNRFRQSLSNRSRYFRRCYEKSSRTVPSNGLAVCRASDAS